MKIALIQTALTWENANANRRYLTEKFNAIAEGVDLIVLPEMFTTGFSMQPQPLAETMDGATLHWMRSMAKNKNAALTGSVIITENGQFYNRLLFVLPSGEVHTYDKRHLFTLAGEDKTYTAGRERLVVDFKGFRICPLVCYDLRFPVFSRNTDNFDVLLYVANWPAPRITAWDALLKARAIENLCYVVGVNRIGSDDNGHMYPGHSAVFDALGNTLATAESAEKTVMVSLDKNQLETTRKKFAFLDDRDHFKLL